MRYDYITESGKTITQDTRMPEYRFRCQIIDASTGEVIEQDWFILRDESIDEFGKCEQADIHVGSMLRNWRRFARSEHEAKK